MLGIKRRKARVIKIGNIRIGGDHPIAIQSMAKTRTCDVQKTVKQIKELKDCGCEIVRLAIRDNSDARAIALIKKQTKVPLVADIHFDWRLALSAISNGADKIRLNPGNIFKKSQIKEVAREALSCGIPIRIGLNSGSIGDSRNQADKMVLLCRQYLRILEGCGFYDIVISLKAQNVCDTIESYRRIAQFCDYPLHLGVTATGLPFEGLVKSSMAIGALLLEGIGDTIRISLTDHPREEVLAARAVLKSLGLRSFGPEIISCPTCGRCEVDLVKIVKDLQRQLSAVNCQLSARPIKLAVMGCVVNGPGEARQADLGIAFGKIDGLMFKKGKPVRKVSAERCVDVLLQEIEKFV